MKVSVYNDWDHVAKAEAEGEEAVVLAWDGEYRKGDIIEFSGIEPGNFYVVKADAAVDEAFCFIEQDTVMFPVPFYEKKQAITHLLLWETDIL